LRAYRITNASLLADKVVAAARTQTVTVAGEATAAVIIGQLAADLQSVNDRIAAVDELIEAVLARHELAEVITSLPGMGPILTAEFIAYAGSLDTYRSPGALAAHAGLAPVARDSGRIQGHQQRPHRYHRRLRRVFSMSTLGALRACPTSRAYYDRKRAEGRTHRQAAAALSRRRVDVLLACIRDNTRSTPRRPNGSGRYPTRRWPRNRIQPASQ
jgi:transposase